ALAAERGVAGLDAVAEHAVVAVVVGLARRAQHAAEIRVAHLARLAAGVVGRARARAGGEVARLDGAVRAVVAGLVARAPELAATVDRRRAAVLALVELALRAARDRDRAPPQRGGEGVPPEELVHRGQSPGSVCRGQRSSRIGMRASSTERPSVSRDLRRRARTRSSTIELA